jgi:arginine utilization protein RocB
MDVVQYIVMAFSVLASVFVIIEKIFGGGNALAGKFHTLDKETTTAISILRNELTAKIERCENQLHERTEEYQKVATVGFDAIKSNIHLLQLAALEFRAKVSEELHLYIRKDDYNAGIGDIKRDVAAGFTRVDARLGELQDLIMYSNPDPAARPHLKPR